MRQQFRPSYFSLGNTSYNCGEKLLHLINWQHDILSRKVFLFVLFCFVVVVDDAQITII